MDPVEGEVSATNSLTGHVNETSSIYRVVV